MSIKDFAKYEKDEYLKFSVNEKPKEFKNSIFYHLLYSLPFIYYIYNFFQLGLSNILYLFCVSIFFEGFLFTVGHLNVHQRMLIYYQNNKIVSPWAYYHHYVHSLLYSEIPFGYRLSANNLFMFFTIVSMIFNINELIFGGIYVLASIDYLAHEYHHSYRKRHYTSLNPLSSKFIGIHFLMSFLEKLKIIDIGTHSSIHHKEKSYNMDLTEDWLDLKFYPLDKFIDWVASGEWFVFKLILEKVVGHSKATFAPNPYYKYLENFVYLLTFTKVIAICLLIKYFVVFDIQPFFSIRYFLVLVSILRNPINP